MRRLLRELAAGNVIAGDTTTLEDFSVLEKTASGRRIIENRLFKRLFHQNKNKSRAKSFKFRAAFVRLAENSSCFFLKLFPRSRIVAVV
jgi:hypothetical protein